MASQSDIVGSKMYEKLKVYNNYANECIFFKFIFDEADLKEEENESDSSRLGAKKPSNGGKENYMYGVVGRSGSSGSISVLWNLVL